MDINTKLIIKVQFNDEIRKMPIHNEDITYDELIIMMERVFKNKLNAEDEIIIKYKDEDNDLITISDDSDLAFAIESSNILKLSLTIENDNKEEATGNNDLSSSEINTIRRELQNIRDHVNRLLDKLVICNGETSINTITSGRTSAIEGKVFQEIGGKEFDPLSISNHAQLPISERNDTSNSLASNSRNEDIKENTRQNHQDIQPESKEIHDLSIAKNQNIMAHNMAGQTQMQSSMNNPPSSMAFNQNKMPPNMGGQNMPPNIGGQNIPSNMNRQTMSPSMGAQIMPPNTGGQSMPPNIGVQNMPHNMGGQNMPPNMGGQNMPPNMGNQNMPPNMGGQNLPPNMGGQSIPPNMGGQNIPPNMGGQNMPPNMGGQNMPPNMGGQNMPPNMGGQNMPPMMGGQIPPPSMPPNMGNQNTPPNMGGPNIPKTNENPMHTTSAFTGNPQQMIGQIPTQRHLYPNAMQPPRMSPSNFQGPANIANTGASQIRSQNYMYSQNPQFNPAMSQPNLNYGYQSSQN